MDNETPKKHEPRDERNYYRNFYWEPEDELATRIREREEYEERRSWAENQWDDIIAAYEED